MVKLFVTSLLETAVYIHLVHQVARDGRSVDQVTNAFDHASREQPLTTAARPGPTRAGRWSCDEAPTKPKLRAGDPGPEGDPSGGGR